MMIPDNVWAISVEADNGLQMFYAAVEAELQARAVAAEKDIGPIAGIQLVTNTLALKHNEWRQWL